MEYAFCNLPFAPMRLDPDHRLEMSNQLIFGEAVEVLEKNAEGWWFVKALYDGYTGWCRNNQLATTELFQSKKIYSADWVSQLEWNNQIYHVPFGSDLSKIPDETAKLNKVDAQRNEFSPENIRAIGCRFLNTTYLWGGKTIFGIDCSGFVQTVLKMFAIPVLRDASQQVTQGRAIGFLDETRCGDLAFFDDEKGDIVHVGILLNSEEIIHASGNVRIDKIDNAGIIHSGTGKRTHKLRIIKRMRE